MGRHCDPPTAADHGQALLGSCENRLLHKTIVLVSHENLIVIRICAFGDLKGPQRFRCQGAAAKPARFQGTRQIDLAAENDPKSQPQFFSEKAQRGKSDPIISGACGLA